MLFAHYGTTSYDALVFLHIVFVLIAFAPMALMPFVRSAAGDDETRQRLLRGLAPYTSTIHGGSLVLAGAVGFGIQALSDVPETGIKVYELGDAWLLWSVVLWVAMNGVLHALVAPGERAIARGGPVGDLRVRIGGPLLTLMFLGTVALMVFKPGV